MQLSETSIWPMMLGGLLSLISAALADVLLTRNAASVRGLILLTLAGTGYVFLSGLPQDLFPAIRGSSVPLVLEASLAPLGGALTLTYLTQWLGVAAEDRWVHYATVWGARALLLASIAVGLLAAWQPQDPELVLQIAAGVNACSVLLATFCAIRAAQLGDVLARWMILACAFLAVAVLGLFVHRLVPQFSDSLGMLAAAFCTVAYFQVVVALAIRRNRQQHRLEKLAHQSLGMDPATGLPRGSVLLSKVGDAFWRSARLGADSTVVCIHLRNLYDLGEVAGHNIDLQILSAMAARIRRAVGFRCVVGLYHPRCFVVVISAIKQPKIVQRMQERLRTLMGKPLHVLDLHDVQQTFVPQISYGSVTVTSADAQAADVIDRAERLAVAAGHVGDTQPAPFDTEPQALDTIIKSD